MEQQAALRAGHGRATLYNWIEDGEVVSVRFQVVGLARWEIMHVVMLGHPNRTPSKTSWMHGYAQAATRFGNSTEWYPDPRRSQSRGA